MGDSVKSSNTTNCTERNCVKETVSDDDGTLFVPNAETLENGVINFGEDIETQQMQYSDDENLVEYQNELYDMFRDMEISNEIPTQYQFEEDKSGDEDGALYNSDNELPNVSPLKPCQKAKKIIFPVKTYKRTCPKQLNESPSESEKQDSISQSDSENEVFLNVPHISSLSTCNTTPSDDGDHIYKIKCLEDEWISKYEDGRYFFLKDSSQTDLVGKCKFGKCLGSFICKWGNCLKLTSEDVVNIIDFRRIGKDQYICTCCGYIAHHDYCGCIKAVEYDRASSTLTYYHQGEHICGVKPNVREHRKALNKLPFPITAYTKPTKYMKDVMYHYIDKEDYNTGFNVSKALSQADVISEIKKLRKNPECAIHRKDELKSFAHVNRIQEALLRSDKDKYLVYKWECKLMGGKASYVFKTTAVSMKIAVIIVGNIKVGSEYSSLRHEPTFFNGMHKCVKFFVSLTLWGISSRNVDDDYACCNGHAS